MDIWAISDLHLGPGGGKGHFSSKWIDHQRAIRRAWDKHVDEDSLVLMPGDLSWNMDEEDLWYDYLWLENRPGSTKVLTSGNHDSPIWQDSEQIHGFCEEFETLHPLIGEAQRFENPYDGGGLVVAATIGAMGPADRYFDSTGGWSKRHAKPDKELYELELVRLSIALSEANELREPGDALVVMVHYPPFDNGNRANAFTRMLSRANVDMCLFGHMHQIKQWPEVFQGNHAGVEYRFVGADFLHWQPVYIGEFTSTGVHFDEVSWIAGVRWKWSKTFDEWHGTVELGDPRQGHEQTVIEGNHRATEPPPDHEDWDMLTGTFGISMSDFLI